MSIYDSKIWLDDIKCSTENVLGLNGLEGKSILVTGAGGLICSAVVDIVIGYNETHDKKIKIIAAGRSEERIRRRFSSYFYKDWFSFEAYDATDAEVNFKFDCDYIIHGASNATPGRIVKEPVETMLSNIIGINNLLEYSVKHNTSRLLFVSSSEVYGKNEGNRPFKEGEYGNIDLLNARNSYSIGKCAAETMCVSYAEEYDLDSVIVRPGHIYGPTASRIDNRVSSAWAYDVADGKNIVMKSDGAQIRSYCYCLDCASAILTVLLKGTRSNAYNISNASSVISIKQMATILAESARVEFKMELPSEEEKRAFNPMSNSSLNSEKLEGLGWNGLFDANEGLSHTVKIIKEGKL